MPTITLPNPRKRVLRDFTTQETACQNDWILPDGMESVDFREYLGFVYFIACVPTGQYYIGKKLLTASAGKKGNRRVRKESNWRDYYGSSTDMQNLVKKYGKENFQRKILSFHHTKFDLALAELKAQLEYDVISNPFALNGILNIRIRIPKKLRSETVN